MTTTKTSKKRAKTVRKRPRKKSKAAPTKPPSSPLGPARKGLGGRPTRLTRELIGQFLGFLGEGLHVSQCAALCGLTHSQVTEYLRVGRHEADAGKRTLKAWFSIQVREGIAALQRRELKTLSDVERIALGWDPLCPKCKRKPAGCGAHPRQAKLAADIARWRLVHRHPKDWHVGTVAFEADQDAPLVPGSAGDGKDGPKTAVAALVMYIPARRDEIE